MFLGAVDISSDGFLDVTGEGLYTQAIAHVEKVVIEKALERTSGNQVKAAKLLGIHRNTLRAKIKKLAINTHRWKIC